MATKKNEQQAKDKRVPALKPRKPTKEK